MDLVWRRGAHPRDGAGDAAESANIAGAAARREARAGPERTECIGRRRDRAIGGPRLVARPRERVRDKARTTTRHTMTKTSSRTFAGGARRRRTDAKACLLGAVAFAAIV